MAIVKLMNAETKPGILPHLCCRCGVPTDTEKQVHFFWCPRWTLILFVINPLVYVVATSVMRTQKTVYLPVCDDHNTYWRGPDLFMIFSIFGAIIGCSAVAILMLGTPQLNEFLTYSILLTVVWVVMSVIIGNVWKQRYVRVTQITLKDITLKNVSVDFAAKLEQDRDRDWEEYEAQRLARRAKSREQNRDND